MSTSGAESANHADDVYFANFNHMPLNIKVELEEVQTQNDIKHTLSMIITDISSPHFNKHKFTTIFRIPNVNKTIQDSSKAKQEINYNKLSWRRTTFKLKSRNIKGTLFLM